MYDSELDHGGGDGGCGGLAAAATVAVVAVDSDWWQKAATNKSVDGCTTACNDKNELQTTTQQPTNEEISISGWRWWGQ